METLIYVIIAGAAGLAIGQGIFLGLICHYLATIAAKMEQRRVTRQCGQSCSNCGDDECPGPGDGDWCQNWRREQ